MADTQSADDDVLGTRFTSIRHMIESRTRELASGAPVSIASLQVTNELNEKRQRFFDLKQAMTTATALRDSLLALNENVDARLRELPS
jgi:hypothetical protein